MRETMKYGYGFHLRTSNLLIVIFAVSILYLNTKQCTCTTWYGINSIHSLKANTKESIQFTTFIVRRKTPDRRRRNIVSALYSRHRRTYQLVLCTTDRLYQDEENATQNVDSFGEVD